MTETVKGKTLAEAEQVFQDFHALLAGDAASVDRDQPELERLACLEGVRAYPMRVKCATLAWHTLRSALAQGQVVSTE